MESELNEVHAQLEYTQGELSEAEQNVLQLETELKAAQNAARAQEQTSLPPQCHRSDVLNQRDMNTSHSCLSNIDLEATKSRLHGEDTSLQNCAGVIMNNNWEQIHTLQDLIDLIMCPHAGTSAQCEKVADKLQRE